MISRTLYIYVYYYLGMKIFLLIRRERVLEIKDYQGENGYKGISIDGYHDES